MNLFTVVIRVTDFSQIYAIGILLIDFHFSNLESAEDQTEDFSCNSTALLLNLTATESNGDRPISLVNQLFIGK